MDRNTICMLVSSSMILPSIGWAQELQEKGDIKSLTWRTAPYRKMKESIQKVPKWVWIGTGSVSVLALGTMGFCFYKKRNDPNFFLWTPKRKDIPEFKERKIRRPRSLSSPERTMPFWENKDDIANLRKELKLVKSSVIDLEMEAYGTTFLGDSPKLSVDGKDIFIVPKDK